MNGFTCSDLTDVPDGRWFTLSPHLGRFRENDAPIRAAAEIERLRTALERVYQTGRGPHVAIAREALNA